MDIREKVFEQRIEEYLCTKGGYQKGNPKSFNPELAFDTQTLLSFIQTTQPQNWKRYTAIMAPIVKVLL